MKKCLLILSLALVGSSLSFGQTTIEEQYFHELKGMEDSSGVTHLFYRDYKDAKNTISSCGGQTQTFYYETDNIFHISPSLSVDSLKFRSFFGESCIGYGEQNTFDYLFYETNPSKWLINITYDYLPFLTDYLKNHLNFPLPIVVKQKSIDDFFFPYSIFLSPNEDSLFVPSDNETLIYSANGANWPEFDGYEEFQSFIDSASIPYRIIGVHPKADSIYFAINSSGDLYRSEHYSQNFILADSNGYHENLYFDADSNYIYSISKYSPKIIVSDDLGVAGSWKFIKPEFNGSPPHYLAVDQSVTGNLFISDSTQILFSDNYGDTFTTLTSVDDEITGLYKKPNSNLLYVLTRKELLEVNTETRSITSLKHISVSSEPVPDETPKKVSLNQNYPNPFNPSTVIRYQLDSNQLVRLEVFDVTGRKVAVLVNGERKSAGTHQVTFDAGNLASGVYFYRLETAGQTFTQKMLLVK